MKHQLTKGKKLSQIVTRISLKKATSSAGIGQITLYNNKGAVSDTPDTFINQLNESDSTKLTYSDTGFELTVNMPQKGTSEVVGNSHSTTDYAGEWKTTVNNLQFYERGPDGKFYTYRYKVQEVSIIDSDTKEEIEMVVQNAEGTGGESVHFTVEYDNDRPGTTASPVMITNTRKTETEITLKKVDVKDLDKAELTADDLLDGARFRIEKYKRLDPLEKDTDWNGADDHSAENVGTDGVFTFAGLTPGIYMIQETEYPEGYVTTTSSPVFRVNEDLSIDLLDGEGNPVDGNRTDTARVVESSLTIILGNTPGFALPSTGGRGIALTYLLGIILTSLAGAGLAMRKRRKAA